LLCDLSSERESTATGDDCKEIFRVFFALLILGKIHCRGVN